MNLTPITDFFSNVKDKITNPFFGTLIFVWVYRNWDLVYTFFNFDEKTKLDDKIKYFKQYFSNKNFWQEALFNIGFTLLLIIIGYFLIIVTRAFSIFVEFQIMPRLTKQIVSKNTVTKELYDEVKAERDDYSDKYEVQRKQVRVLSRDYDEISENYKKSSTRIAEQSTRINTLENEANEFAGRLNEERNKRLDQEQINIDEVTRLNEEIKRLQRDYSDKSLQDSDLIENLREALRNATVNNKNIAEHFDNLEKEYQDKIIENEKEINLLKLSLEHKNEDLHQEIESNKRNHFIADRLRHKKTRLVDIGESQILEVEYEGQLIFYNLTTHRFYDIDQIYQTYNSYTVFEINDIFLINQAVEKFRKREQ